MKSLVVGVAGGSGSGKTTLARALHELLPQTSAILYQDSYYIDQSHRFDQDGGAVNFDHPESLEFSLLARHLQSLRSGEAVEVPQYDFATHKRLTSTTHFSCPEVVIVDGTLLLSQPDVCHTLDVKIFVDTPEKLRFERRLERDVRERGRTADGVHRQFYNQVKPMHDLFVEASKSEADLIFAGELNVKDGAQRLLNHLKLLKG